MLATLALPRPSTGQWAWNAGRGEAYVVEQESPASQVFVRRIRLDGLLDLGAIPVGLPASTVRSLAEEASGLVASTSLRSDPCSEYGELTRIDSTVDPPRVDVASTGVETMLTPVAEMNLLLSERAAPPCMPFGNAFVLRRMSDLHSSRSLSFPAGTEYGHITDMAWDGTRLWVSLPLAGALLWFHPSDSSWTWHSGALTGSPSQVEILRDPLVHSAGVLSIFYTDDPWLPSHELLRFDPLRSTPDAIGLRPSAESLLGVAIP